MIHSLSRHGKDPKTGATLAMLKVGQRIAVDCDLGEAKRFLTALKRAVKNPDNTNPIPIVLPTIMQDTKTFITGAITWRHLFEYEEGANSDKFRMKNDDGDWFDVILACTSNGNSMATRVEMQRIVIRRHVDGDAVPTTTNRKDEVQLEKVGYAYIDALGHTLDEDLSRIAKKYTGEIVVPIANYPNTPFFLGVHDRDATQVLKKGQWKIALKHSNGKRYLIRAEHPGSSTFVIERVSN